MTNLNVTIQLSEGDRAKLDAILAALQNLATPSIREAEPTQVVPEPVKPEPVATAPVEPSPAPVEKGAPAPAPKQTETAPEVTTAELQSKVVQLVSAACQRRQEGSNPCHRPGICQERGRDTCGQACRGA